MALALQIICEGRQHCATCRDLDGGREWRSDLAKAFTLPPDAPDFACPHGFVWGDAPAPLPQPTRPPREPSPGKPGTPSKPGPGDLVQIVIDKLRFTAASGCGCAAFKRKMNEWGWWGCWRNRDLIVDWFVEKGSEAGVEIGRASVYGLLKTAIREYRRTRKSLAVPAAEGAVEQSASR